jgi:cell division transport system permease protein
LSVNQPKIKQKRRISYFSSIVSIAMVLFMLGLFGIILINGNKLQQYLKENFQLTLFFNEAVPEADIQRVYQTIQQADYTKRAVYVTKDQAAQKFSQEIGQDFVGFLGYNPLLPSIELFLKSGYTSPVKIKTIDVELRRNPEIQDVVFQQTILDEINKNVNTIATILVALSLVFLVISITLINNTIRLNLYARRFIIKSMQMVGATRGFIIKPFVFRSFLHGLYGGAIACILLLAVLSGLPRWISGIEILYDNTQFAMLFGVIILAGILISMMSSLLSTNHYLKLKIDDLY